jgi:DNA-binding transcriptional MerR regulator
MTTESKQTFSIGDTAKMTRATQKQIRNWEARGYISLAERVVSGCRGYRRFSTEHVEIISSIKNLIDEGYTLPAAAKMARNAILNHRKESKSGGSD